MYLFPLERNGAWGWKPYFGKHSAAGDKVSENVYVKKYWLPVISLYLQYSDTEL